MAKAVTGGSDAGVEQVFRLDASGIRVLKQGTLDSVLEAGRTTHMGLDGKPGLALHWKGDASFEEAPKSARSSRPAHCSQC